jgi:hypothetical protein
MLLSVRAFLTSATRFSTVEVVAHIKDVFGHTVSRQLAHLIVKREKTRQGVGSKESRFHLATWLQSRAMTPTRVETMAMMFACRRTRRCWTASTQARKTRI